MSKTAVVISKTAVVHQLPPQVFASDTTNYGHFILAMVVVAGLLFALKWVLQWFAERQGMMAVKKTKDAARLEIVAQQAVDLKRRLVVTRWDNREFLLLLSADSALVVGEQAMPLAPQIKP